MPEAGPIELLVVEDNPIVRLDMSDRLRRRGFTVLRAGGADQALRIMEAHPSIRGVLSDREMPGSIDGLELLHVIAGRWPGRRLILISGLSAPRAEDMPLAAVFLLKPVSRGALDRALHGLLPLQL